MEIVNSLTRTYSLSSLELSDSDSLSSSSTDSLSSLDASDSDDSAVMTASDTSMEEVHNFISTDNVANKTSYTPLSEDRYEYPISPHVQVTSVPLGNNFRSVPSFHLSRSKGEENKWNDSQDDDIIPSAVTHSNSTKSAHSNFSGDRCTALSLDSEEAKFNKTLHNNTSLEDSARSGVCLEEPVAESAEESGGESGMQGALDRLQQCAKQLKSLCYRVHCGCRYSINPQGEVLQHVVLEIRGIICS